MDAKRFAELCAMAKAEIWSDMRECLAEIEQLRVLGAGDGGAPGVPAALAGLPTEPDWDGYGNPPPSAAAIATATHLLTEAQVTPMSHGGLLVEWRNGDFTVEIDEDGAIIHADLPDRPGR